MEKLFTVSKNKTWNRLWLRSSALIAKFRLKLKKVGKTTRPARYQFSSVPKSCLTLCNPMDCSTPGLLVHYQLLELAQAQVHQVGDAIHFIFCRPLLRMPSVFPRIRVFSSQSFLCIRWPKYWSFNFSISPFNEYSGQISFRKSACSPRDSQVSSPTPQFKSINSSVLSFIYSPTLISIHDYWKSHSFD